MSWFGGAHHDTSFFDKTMPYLSQNTTRVIARSSAEPFVRGLRQSNLTKRNLGS